MMLVGLRKRNRKSRKQKGIEISIGWEIIQRRNESYQTQITIGFKKSTIWINEINWIKKSKRTWEITKRWTIT